MSNSKALPRMFYGDPSECVDELRRIRESAKRQAMRLRAHKARRIQALVRDVIKNGGGHGA